MNKRLFEFLNDLAEENERLETELKSAQKFSDAWRDLLNKSEATEKQLRKEIRTLKARLKK